MSRIKVQDIQHTASANEAISLASDSSVELKHTGNQKLVTSGTGVSITGTCVATEFSGSGASLTSLPAANITGSFSSLNLTGTTTAVDLTVSGNLTVNGTTSTLNSTNTTITDNLLELNSGVSSNANDSGIIIERGSTGDNAIFAWDESADKFIIGTTTATASDTGDLTIAGASLVTGSVEDSKGDLRDIPQNSQTSAYSLVSGDAGKHISITTGGVTIPASTFAAGDAVTIVNDSASDQTITCSAVTTYLAADTSAKSSLTLKARGIATFLFVSASVVYGAGAGLE